MKHTYLYHYTSAEGLKGIVENRRIWATDIFGLNDWTEFLLGRDAAVEYLAELCPGALGDDAGQMEWIKKEVAEISVGRCLHTYVCSFSNAEDDVSQWRAYCPRGGYAIGFPMERLRALTKAKTSDFNLRRCEYRRDRQKAIMKAMVDEALRQEPDAYTKVLAGKGDETAKSAIRCALSNTLHWRLAEKSPTIKSTAFKSEREWRAISKPRSDNYKATRKFRVRNGLTIPYLELSLDDAELWRDARAFVGPCAHPKEAREFVRMLLTSELQERDGKKPLPTACAGRIMVSGVPYRYW